MKKAMIFAWRYPRSNELTPSPVMKTKTGKYISRSFFSYQNWRNTWTKAIEQCPADCAPRGKRRVMITRFYAGRERPMDSWNLYTGGKIILDALVHNGWLIDDDDRGIIPPHLPNGSVATQQRSSKAYHFIEVVVEDLEPHLNPAA